METSPLDPSLPGVRLLQSWIREQLPLSIGVVRQEPIEGRLVWQDPEFLAIERAGASRPVLINRRQISVIRSLGSTPCMWHDRNLAERWFRERCQPCRRHQCPYRSL